MLRRALDGDRAQRLLALQALDARADGAGLGVLAPDGSAPLAPATAAALQRLGGALRARVFALVDDSSAEVRAPQMSPEIRALALRVAAKLGEPGLTPARVVAAAATAPALLQDAAAFALSVIAAHHPEARAAIPSAVAPLLADTTSWERRLAAVGMLAPAGPAARPLLEEAAKDPSPFVRSAAVSAGAAAGSIAILVAGAADPTPAVRAAVARALARKRAPAQKVPGGRFRRSTGWRFRRSSSKLGPRLGSAAQGSLGPRPRCPGALRTLTCATGP